ncbi:MAG: phage tail sheath subtilisin-like domain-containing protein [Desulfobacteraceae bacterium]|nr:phage tail sheath subtilisin-like domain-containing protein [Desulfobacteraceae bacterium]
MATSYRTPGIYMEEVPSGPRPIEAVGTSTVGFVGIAPDAGAHVNKAIAITSWLQFLKEFASEKSESTHLAQAVFGFFQNGSGLCYVVNTGKNGSIAGGGKSGREGIRVFETIDEIAIVAAPGYTDPASYEAVLSHCEKMKDRVAILDAPQEIAALDDLTKVATPSSKPKPKDDEKDTSGKSSDKGGGARARKSDRGFGAYYFPWIVMQDPFSPKNLISAPPSGHIAGVYARVDSARGVHKAPANEPLKGALDLSYRITREEQGNLNINSVNCIRFFPGQGIRIWGARTLADSGSEWRYINVRRLFNMIEESISRSTSWVVFEPNDATLWNSIKRDVGSFLTMLWRQGALKGATPEEAFFVKCDAETNPPDVIDAGMVVTVIGIAPVKPAEFVIFRIGQSEAGAQVEISEA